MNAGAPNDRPTSLELVEAVREFLVRDVVEETEGRLRFHARVAANALSMVERELVAGEEMAERHRVRLARLGLDTEAELAAAVRTGELDDRMDEVKAVIRETVADKLRVANPDHLDPRR